LLSFHSLGMLRIISPAFPALAIKPLSASSILTAPSRGF